MVDSTDLMMEAYMTQYERDHHESDVVTELLGGLKGPWFLSWDDKSRKLTAVCCQCAHRVTIVVTGKVLVRELTSRLAHKC